MFQPEEMRLDAIRPWLESKGWASRDWGLLGAALDRPWMTFSGEELYPSVWLKTAALLDSVEASHPLLDGNKRLGVLLAIMMLKLHGVHAGRSHTDFWFDLVTHVASEHPQIEDIAARIEMEFS